MVARKRCESKPVRAKSMSNAGRRPSKTVSTSGRVVEELERRVMLSAAVLAFAPQVTFAVGAGPQAVSTVDLNRDGKLDLVVANSADNSISVLIGNGDGTFAAQQTYGLGGTPGG